MLGIKNVDLLQRLRHFSVRMEMWKWYLYWNWQSSPLNTKTMLLAGHCLPHSCVAESSGTELWHLKKIANSFFVNIFNNNPVLKLNQNVNNARGASFFWLGFSHGRNVREAVQWASPQHQLFWAGQAHVVLISFTTEEKEGYPSLSQSVALH